MQNICRREGTYRGDGSKYYCCVVLRFVTESGKTVEGQTFALAGSYVGIGYVLPDRSALAWLDSSDGRSTLCSCMRTDQVSGPSASS